MAVRTAYAGTASAGDVYTAANHAKMPGGWIGYAERTTDVVVTSDATAKDVTDVTVTVTVGSSRRIKISVQANMDVATAPNVTAAYVRDGSNNVVGTVGAFNFASTSDTAFFTGWCEVTPSSGSHTYKLSVLGVGGGNMTVQCSAESPACILVEDIGPAS